VIFYIVADPIYASTSAHPDSRYEDSDRYTLIAPVRIAWQRWTINGISTLGKGKVPVLSNGMEAYSKEVLGEEIRRLTVANV